MITIDIAMADQLRNWGLAGLLAGVGTLGLCGICAALAAGKVLKDRTVLAKIIGLGLTVNSLACLAISGWIVYQWVFSG